MASILDSGLIDVNFIDETNYITPSSTDDVVGMVVDANWGPVMKPVVCDSTRFRSIFNPNGLGRLSTSMISAHRCFAAGASLLEVVRAPRTGEKWVFFGLKDTSFSIVPKDSDSDTFAAPEFATALEDEYVAGFRLRYYGAFPMAVVLKDSGRKISGVPLYTIQVCGLSGVSQLSYTPAPVEPESEKLQKQNDLEEAEAAPAESKTLEAISISAPQFGSVLETLQVTFSPLTLNGVSYFYADVIAANSQYLVADSVWAVTAGGTSEQVSDKAYVLGMGDCSVFVMPSNDKIDGSKQSERDCVLATVADTLGLSGSDAIDYGGDDDIANGWDASFDASTDQSFFESTVPAAYGLMDDRDLATSTLLINSFAYSDFVAISKSNATDSYQSLCATLCDVAERRKDLNALVGYPTEAGEWNKIYAVGLVNLTEAQKYFDKVSSGGLWMFGSGLVAWERYLYSSVLGQAVVDLDGTALWAGRMASTAYALRNRNQVPSYKAYGRVSATLVRSLPLAQVKRMHDALGVASIYSSVTGNYIFGIRNLFAATESYFARLNVTRVIGALLSGVYDLVEEVIHTDVAANRSSRLQLEARLQSYMGNMIARKELRPESTADVGDSLNADSVTNGGRVLRIHLVCYFMSLTEKVEITVIARDNSVLSTEITQG